MATVSLEKIVTLVVQQVVQELAKNGIQVVSTGSSGNKTSVNTGFQGLISKSERIDMSKYKSPVLTENQLNKLHELTGEVIIPKGTVITPKARQIIQKKQLQITFE